MEQFIDHLVFACMSAVGIGVCFAIIAGIYYIINKLTSNKLDDAISSMYEDVPDFEEEN